jgi:hypothetical protein
MPPITPLHLKIAAWLTAFFMAVELAALASCKPSWTVSAAKCRSCAGKVAKMARFWPARNSKSMAGEYLIIVDCVKGTIANLFAN